MGIFKVGMRIPPLGVGSDRNMIAWGKRNDNRKNNKITYCKNRINVIICEI